MHAFLIIGTDNIKVKEGVGELTQKLKTKILEFPLSKIADTRELKNVTKLTFNTPTAIIIDSIDLATEEAVNAFLKNLEEPQENIYYILTASNLRNVLPTIISRCEIIKIAGSKTYIPSEDVKKFLEFPVEKKLKDIDKIKDRGEAKEFVLNLIEVSHFNLLNFNKNRLKQVMNLEILIKTLNNLKLNGNVGLQLANMVIGLN